MSYRSALGRAKGLGSAGGVEHWWKQRVSAVFLVPLCAWLMFSFASRLSINIDSVYGLFASPVTAVGTTLLMVFAYVHAWLGLQVVIEDYIHTPVRKFALLLATKGLLFTLCTATIFAIIKLHFFQP